MLKRKRKKNPDEKRKIDILAEEKFDGDVLKTLQNHFDNNMSIEQYVSELNEEESLFVLNWTHSVIVENCGGEENAAILIKSEVKLRSCLSVMGMTSDEVRVTDKNPFISKTFKNTTILLVGTAVLSLISIWLKDTSLGEGVVVVLPIFTGFLALRLANDIMSIFKFKKAKKLIAIIDEVEVSIPEEQLQD